MEQNETNLQKIDLIFLIRILLRYARRFWLLGVILAVLCAGALGIAGSRGYTPVYEASVSFTVRVANPLFAQVNAYNNVTTQQLNNTFPYILRSSILRRRICEHLGTESIPEVTTSVLPNSNIFTIRVRDGDPEWAYKVLTAVVDCYPQVADYVVGDTDLVMLDDSGVPTAPVNGFSMKGALVKGGAAGFGLWMALLVLLALTRSTVHNEDELRRMVNLECLGIIPATKVVARGRKNAVPLVHHDAARFGFSESVRLLQMHVLKKMKVGGHQVLMVSGATPGEGKTTVAVNLAVAMAQRGRRVLLVDCDMYHPSVRRALGMEQGASMRDVLQGKAPAAALVASTSVENLSCFNADGDFKERSVKKAFKELMQTFRANYDMVILDTPPCSLMVDAAELADYADCGLMVVRQDYARADQIVEGIRLMTDNGLPMVGCVLNGVAGNLSSTGYQYGNGYGYGRYGGYGYGSGYASGYGYGGRKHDSD